MGYVISSPTTYAFLIFAAIADDIGQSLRIFLFVIELLALLTAILSRLDLQIEVILMLPYMGLRVYQLPDFARY
jgi:hypothetical protein